jgi:uncharacterized protein
MNTYDVNYDFLGTGWSFPPTFNDVSGDVQLTSMLDDIKASLAILLSTSIGERLMQPGYGCNLNRFLFEPIDSNLISYMEKMIKDAIFYHEPRIRPEKIVVDSSYYLEGKIMITVEFTVSATNSRYNFVYPYYLNEGNGVSR